MQSTTNLTVVNLNIEGSVQYDGAPINLTNLENIHMFTGVDTANNTLFTVEIGYGTENVPIATPCTSGTDCANWNVVSIGNQAGANNTGDRGVFIGLWAGLGTTGTRCTSVGPEAGARQQGIRKIAIGNAAGKDSSGNDTISIGHAANEGSIVDHTISIGYTAGRLGNSSETINLGVFAGNGTASGLRNVNIGSQAGRFSAAEYCVHLGYRAGLSNTHSYCHTNGRESVCTAPNQYVFGSSAYPLHLRLPSDTGSYCTGAAYDTCLNRGRAGAFELGAGQDAYTTGFFCAGPGCTSSAPSASSVGIYDSGIRTVRSCTAGAGIASCTVTDGDLAVAASPASLPTYTTVAVSDNGDGTGSATCNANHCLFTLGSVAWALGLSYTVTVSNTLIGPSSYPRAALVYADVEDNAYAQAGQPGTGSIAVRIFAADIPSKTAFTIDLLAAA